MDATMTLYERDKRIDESEGNVYVFKDTPLSLLTGAFGKSI